jgi:ACS family hexuronate transporter-like MFS transporter
LLCRTLLGFFEAGRWPCALKTTFALLEEKDRTPGNSILQSGASLGAVITPQIPKALMTQEEGSWRHAFAVVGCVGFVWVGAWFLCVRRRDVASDGTRSLRHSPVVSAVFQGGRFWAVALLIIGAQTAWHIYRVWLMKFLQTGRGYEQQAALDFNSVYFLATDVGCILAGVTSVWLVRKLGCTPHQSRRHVYAGGCVLTSLSLLLPWMDKGWGLLLILLLIGAGSLSLFPCYYSFVQEVFPPLT